MMPEVGAVLDAVRVWLVAQDAPEDMTGPGRNIALAVAALDAKLATVGQAPSKVEQDRTWGEVVAGDEILSAKTGKFYEVVTSVKAAESKVKVMIKGSGKYILRPAADPIRIKRGVSGEVVDVLEVLFSGQTKPTIVRGSNDVGPMLKTKTEEEEADDVDS
jgi:hypothetical protein